MTGLITNKNKGFTLVELIVVMAVFLFIIGAAIGIFISIMQNQKRILSEQQFLNQISYAEEYMSKALRMAGIDESGACLVDEIEHAGHPGFIYLLTKYDSSSGFYRGIKFINKNGDESGNAVCQEFYLDNSDSNNFVLKEVKDGGTPVDLTSSGLSGVKIESLKFSVNGMDGSATLCPDHPNSCGASNSDLAQPRVTIIMRVKVPGDNQQPIRTIQTTVSQRNLNLPQ